MNFFRFPIVVIDSFMATRPVLLIPVWGFCALGFRSGMRIDNYTGIADCWQRNSLIYYMLLLIFSLSVAAVYVMNQLSDIEVDKKNGGMPLIANGIVSVKAAWGMVAGCSAISIITPLLMKHYVLALAAAAALLTGVVYCFKPFRFSGRPILDFISNAFGYGVVAFGAGWNLAGKEIFSIAFIINALPYFLLMCGGSISSTIPDIEGDRFDKKNTTAVTFGILPSHILAMTLIFGAAAAGYLMHDSVALVCAGLSLPCYFGYLFYRKAILIEATYKIGGALCMIAAFISLPYFIPVACVVFSATWLYFRIRHGISYPSLKPSTHG